MTKVAFVVQRYGPEIVGGAESLCRSVAENLVRRLGWDVTVYTSCARDYVSWKNVETAGTGSIHGVRVKRFPVRFPRSLYLFGFANHKLTPLILRWGQKKGLPRILAYWLERLWLILQGPYCPALVKQLKAEAGAYDKIFFFTYLYYPTLRGAAALAGRPFSLIPTAHDEPPFYFQHTAELLDAASSILVNIDPEGRLIERRMARSMESIRVGGIGLDIGAEERAPEGLEPYILYLGRICKAKGVQELLDAFAVYRKQNPGSPLKLVLVGQQDVEFEIPDSPEIQFLGFVSDATKFALIRNSVCVINPSQYESLSLIAVEAMLCQIPLILNEESEVLAHYCATTSTCFPYRGTEGLVSSLQGVLARDWSSDDNRLLLASTRLWAEQHYSWAAVMRAYDESPNF